MNSENKLIEKDHKINKLKDDDEANKTQYMKGKDKMSLKVKITGFE